MPAEAALPDPRAERIMEEERAEEGRRRWLSRLVAAVTGLVGAVAVLPVVGFLIAPVKREVKERWRDVGDVDAFPVGRAVKVVLVDPDPVEWAGFVAENAAFLRREAEDRFVAFSVYCTHVGCPIRWVEGAQLFLCPCHGGAFRSDGAVAAGPPPRPLATHRVRIRDGRVQVETRALPIQDA